MALMTQLVPSQNQSAFNLKRWRELLFPLPSSDQTHYDGRNPGSVLTRPIPPRRYNT
jgi:hypothetical protein